MTPYSIEEQERVRATVQRFLLPSFDREWIVDSILLEGILKNVPHISTEHIRQRCMNSMRKRTKEQKHNERLSREPRPSEVVDSGPAFVEQQDFVNALVQNLTDVEKRLIWMRFYDDKTLEEIVLLTRLPREDIQHLIQLALYKMRLGASR